MSLEVLVNDIPFVGYKTVSVKTSFLELSGTATILMSFKDISLTPFPIRVQDSVSITINNEPVITGFADKLTHSVLKGSHIIEVSIRDILSDVIDSIITADVINQIKAPIGLKKLCQIVLKALGITIDVIENVSSKPFITGEILSPPVGTTFFKFLELYAQQRQIILHSDGLGNLVLDQGSKETYITHLGVLKTATKGFIRSSTIAIDYTKRFNRYTLQDQNDPLLLEQLYINYGSDKFITDISTSKSVQFDSDIRPSRHFAFTPKTTYAKESLKDRTIWEVNFRRSQSLIYECEVEGFVPPLDEDIWRYNRLVNVTDYYSGISQSMLLDQVEYFSSLSEGNGCKLRCVSPDAYTLQAERDERTSVSGDEGDAWLSKLK